MIRIIKYLYYLSIASTVVGASVTFPPYFPSINIYFSDVCIGLLCVAFISKYRVNIKLWKIDRIVRYFTYFAIVALVSNLFSPINLTFYERIVSLLYLVRICAYFVVYLTGIYLVRERIITKMRVLKLLASVGIFLSILGWVQYFLYPDLRNLYYLGWDPHYKRIFGTILDPNYFGLFMILTVLILLSTKIFKKFARVSLFFVLVTLAFTYSRSSYLALVVSLSVFSLSRKQYKLLWGIVAFLILSFLFLPRPGGVGVQLERVFSFSERVNNWRLGARIFSDYPILGVGFNTLRYVRKNYTIIEPDWVINHAGAGLDNSPLFVAVTTGIVGILTFSGLLFQIFKNKDELTKLSLVAILVHSLFLNSFFLPWTMLWLWTLSGLTIRD